MRLRLAVEPDVKTHATTRSPGICGTGIVAHALSPGKGETWQVHRSAVSSRYEERIRREVAHGGDHVGRGGGRQERGLAAGVTAAQNTTAKR